MSIIRILILVVVVFFVFFILYKMLSYRLYKKLQRQLTNGTLEGFKKMFGREAHHRSMKQGGKRYRWQKGLITVKASFDQNGAIISKKMQPFRFFSLQTEIIFLDEQRFKS